MEPISNHRRGKQSRSRVHAKSTIRNKRRWSQKRARKQAIAHIKDTHRGDLEYRPTVCPGGRSRARAAGRHSNHRAQKRTVEPRQSLNGLLEHGWRVWWWSQVRPLRAANSYGYTQESFGTKGG